MVKMTPKTMVRIKTPFSTPLLDLYAPSELATELDNPLALVWISTKNIKAILEIICIITILPHYPAN